MKKEICENCKKPTCLDLEDIDINLAEMEGWKFNKAKKSIEKEYQFKNFVKGIEFVNMVSDIAEEYDHHPDILISYNKVTLSLSTHDLDCASSIDFELAKKIDTVKNI